MESLISGLRGLETSGAESKRSPDPKETFDGSQLAAISSIVMDFLRIHKISQDFMESHVFQGSEICKRDLPNANGVLTLNKPVFDSGWLGSIAAGGVD